VSTSVTERVKQ